MTIDRPGRPKAPYITKTMRIPVDCLAQVILIVRQYKEALKRK